MSTAADKPFKVLFDNQDAGTNHDWDVLDASGKKVYDSKDFPGVAKKTLEEEVKSLARKQHQTVSELVRAALRLYLTQAERETVGRALA